MLLIFIQKCYTLPLFLFRMADAVNEKIVAQGNKVRELKGAKAEKAEIKAAVDVLLSLKAEYKSLAGMDFEKITF